MEITVIDATAKFHGFALYCTNRERHLTVNHKKTHDAVNKSRNEQQKSVLLIEVIHQLCDTSARLIEQTKKLSAHSKSLHESIKDSQGRR